MMADDAETKIEIEGDSEAAVALALARMLLAAEDAPERPTQDDILAAYRSALAAVRGEEWIEVDGEFEDDEDEDDEDEAEPAPSR
jgi:Ran GTPase-activating protein (RanGAP) involved in mRNA processing and transport